MKKSITIRLLWCAIAFLISALDVGRADVSLTAQVVFGGIGDQQGTGIAVSGGNVYFSGRTAVGTGDGLVGCYNDTLTIQNWFQPLGGNGAELMGVAVSNSVYAAGGSLAPLTRDIVGGAEQKCVTVSVGTGGGAYNWITQTPAPPGFFPYGGSEQSNAIVVSSLSGVDSVYTVGQGEAFTTYGYPNSGLTLAMVNQAGSVVATTTFGGNNMNAGGFGITTMGGNIYVVGMHGPNALIRAYNGSLTSSLWGDETLAGRYNGITAYNGDLYAVGNNGSDGIVACYSSAGTCLWSQTYAGDVLNGVVGDDGTLYAVGSAGSNAILLGLDLTNGNVLNSDTVGGSGTNVFNGIALNSADGSLYAIGTTDSASLGATGQDIWIASFAIPEPATLLLLGLGGLAVMRKRR